METGGREERVRARSGWTWRLVLMLSATYEMLALASAIIPGFPGGAASSAPSGAGMAALALACALATATLLMARRAPCAASISCCALYAVATALGCGGFFGVPALVSLYALGRWTSFARVAAAGAVSLAAAATGSALGAPGFELTEALTSALTLAMPIALGMALSAREESARARELEFVERTRSKMLEAQRDDAVSRARVATELHDSVGHGLTVIIALSEGLKGVLARDPEVREALLGINETACECLAQTREAVTSLADPGADARQPRSALRKWDDVAPVLARARKAGVACALTETGRRPSDPAQSDLAFSVTREAVTNALRHGQASSIIIAWDHRADGSLALSVRDDDAPEGVTSDPEDDAHLTPATAGTGLTRLERRVRGAGGTFFAGPSEGSWTLRANIPASTSAGVSPVEGGRL